MNDEQLKQSSDSVDVSKDEAHNDAVLDISIEADDEENNPKETIKKLRTALKNCTKEKQDYLDGWQRIKAEFVNAKRLEEESRKSFVQFSEARLVEELIPILESFDMATANRTLWESLPKEWRIGMEQVQNQLIAVLGGRGLSTINPLGETFDPAFHSAVGVTPVSEKSRDQKVEQVVQKGYSLQGKTLRPARVLVGEFKE